MDEPRAQVTVVAAERDPLQAHELGAAIEDHPKLMLVEMSRGGREAVEAVRAHRPQIALIDAALPDLRAPMVLYALRERPETRVLFLMEDPGSDMGLRLIGAGAGGCLMKAAGSRRICGALVAAAAGRAAASPDLGVLCSPARAGAIVEDDPELTVADRRLLAMIAEGLSVDEIAARTRTEPAHVLEHASLLCRELGADECTGAVAEGLRRGLLPV